MILSKAAGYAIRALAYIAGRANGPCGLRAIAEQEKIPPVFLRKVLGDLRRHGLLRSSKGIYGGYELACPPESITLWDVVRLVDPNPSWDSCILGYESHDPKHLCPMHEEWAKKQNELISMLQARTIAGIAQSAKGAESGSGDMSAARCCDESPAENGEPKNELYDTPY